MPSLAERLQKMGVKKGNEITVPEKSGNLSFAQVINASEKENQLGKVLIVENNYDYGYRHGNVEFLPDVEYETIHKAGRVSQSINNLKKLVFIDTETTGLSGGTGTIAFLVGCARFSDQGLKLTQMIVEDPSDEPAMLLELSNYCEDIEAVISFNGKSFDIPLLKARYVLNRLPEPFLKMGHLDLLHVSRRIWRQRLPNRSLKDLEQQILEIPRSEEEVPGWMIPEIYFNFLRSGDASQINNVIYHNAMDIVSLAALYISITNMFKNGMQPLELHLSDKFAIGQIYENIGDNDRALEIYEQCSKSKSFDQQLRIEIFERIALLYKKQSKWIDALPYWESNGQNGNIDSCIELAKYYEHETKEYQKALDWTLKANSYLENSKIPRYKKNSMKNVLLYRKNRLEKRIENAF